MQSWTAVIALVVAVATLVSTVLIALNTNTSNSRAQEAKRARWQATRRSEEFTSLREYKRDTTNELGEFLSAHERWQQSIGTSSGDVQPVLARLGLLAREVALAQGDRGILWVFRRVIGAHAFFIVHDEALRSYGNEAASPEQTTAERHDDWVLGHLNGMLDVVKDDVLHPDTEAESDDLSLLPDDILDRFTCSVRRTGEQIQTAAAAGWFTAAEQRWLPAHAQGTRTRRCSSRAAS